MPLAAAPPGSARPGRKLARVVLAWVLCAASATVSMAPPARAAGQVGEAAPDFSLVGIDGATYTLSAYRGKVVFLFFLGYS